MSPLYDGIATPQWLETGLVDEWASIQYVRFITLREGLGSIRSYATLFPAHAEACRGLELKPDYPLLIGLTLLSQLTGLSRREQDCPLGKISSIRGVQLDL